MLKVPLRLGALIALALLLVVGVVWRFSSAGGDAEADPIAARIQRHRQNGDAAALAREASSADVKVARLAIHALAGSGPAGVPHIERAMRDKRPRVREAAAAALGRAAGRDRSAPLAEAAGKDPAANVRATAAAALGRMRAYNEMETLMAVLEDRDRAVRGRANAAICRITGVHFKFRAGDPPTKRREAIATIRELWRTMKPAVEQYYTSQRAGDRKR